MEILGIILIIAGILGMLSGISSPLNIHNVHGKLGFGKEWELLSSAAGIFLSTLLIIAGIGFIKTAPWAISIAWSYVLGGIIINVTDLYLFTMKARPSPSRTTMIFLDSAALLLPIILGIFLWMSKN